MILDNSVDQNDLEWVSTVAKVVVNIEAAKFAPVSTLGGQPIHVCTDPQVISLRIADEHTLTMLRLKFSDKIVSLLDVTCYEFGCSDFH